MARVTRCTPCGIRFYDASEKAVSCPRCEKREAEKAMQITKWKQIIASRKRNGTFHIGFAMIDLYYREKLSLADCAKVLSLPIDDVQLARDIVRQNAR